MTSEPLPLRKRLRLPFWQRADIEAEIASHLAEAEADLRAQGMGRAEARQAALERFGDVDAVATALQAVHQGWIGGATVQQRFAKVVLTAAAVLAAVGVWVVVFALPFGLRTGRAERAEAEGARRLLEQVALTTTEPAAFRASLLQWQRDQPNVTWMGIVDKSGLLVWSDPDLGWDGKPLREARVFLARFDERGGVRGPARGGYRSAFVWPLSKKLAAAGTRVAWFDSQPLGGRRRETYAGTAIIAFAPPLWGERFIGVVSSVWFWYGVVWLLAAGAILLHGRGANPRAAWGWAGAALFLGPLAWLGYLGLPRFRKAPAAEGLRPRRLTLVPLLGLVLTAVLLARPALAVPLGWVDLYAVNPERGAAALRQSGAGVRILLRATESPTYRTRRAAVDSLMEIANSREQGPPLFASWAHLLMSRYADVRRAAWLPVQSISVHDSDSVDPQQLFLAWKTALGHRDKEIRTPAWIWFRFKLMRPDEFPYRFADKIPELLALGKGDASLAHILDEAVRATYEAGVISVNPDDYGIPPERQKDILPWGLPVMTLGPVVIGSERPFGSRFEPWWTPARLPVAVRALPTAGGPRCSGLSLETDPRPMVRLRATYQARGPAGRHRQLLELVSKDGQRLGLIEVQADEVAGRG